MSAGLVLVVDDSSLGRAVVRRALVQAGFEVIEAADGVEGAVLALRERPTVVVTDLEMPTMDGYQLLQLLRSDPATANTPVLVVTTHDEAPSRFWGRRAGADAYLTKDYQPAELVATVRGLAVRAVPGPPAVGPPPSGPLDVLTRLASHLDKSLLRATLTNTLLERGVAAGTLHETAGAALRTVGEVVDAEILGVAVADTEGTTIHVLLPHPVAAATVGALRERLLLALPRTGGWAGDVTLPGTTTPFTAAAFPAPTLDVVISGEVVPGAAPRSLAGLVVRALPMRGAAGAIAVDPRDASLFAQASSELFESILGPLAVVLDNARLGQRLAELSMLDGLTRLLNHRAIYERLTEELSRARRYGHALSVVLCDFDHFKRVNDNFGHIAGDAVLRAAAAVMRPCLRTPDVLGRYGGEEFVAVLPESDLVAGLAAAERLRRALQTHPIELPGGDRVEITASFGVAAANELDASASPQALVSLADTRLYAAKAAGRNLVRPLASDL
jgi:two-component system cell cycle response regulator